MPAGQGSPAKAGSAMKAMKTPMKKKKEEKEEEEEGGGAKRKKQTEDEVLDIGCNLIKFV